MTTQANVFLQLAVDGGDWPSEDALRDVSRRAVGAVFAVLGIPPHPETELSMLFVEDAAVRGINAEWRGIDKATNVLSFPVIEVGRKRKLPPMLGDIVLAHETIVREAEVENKPFDHHLTHLIVHGLLHLLGYDHETDTDASQMEALETEILKTLAIPDPYGMIRAND